MLTWYNLAASMFLTGVLATAASAQQRQTMFVIEGQAIGLLSSPQVQQELGLDPDQVRRADAAARAATAQILDAGQKLLAQEKAVPGSGRDEVRVRNSVAAAGYRKEIRAILKPEQLERLRAITIRQFRWQVFQDPEVRDELGLTEDQRGKVDATLARMNEETSAISKLMRNKETRKQATAAAFKLNDRTLASLVDILDDHQKRQWQKMKGDPAK